MTGRLHEITGQRARFAPANGSSACGGSAGSVAVAAQTASPGALLATAHKLPQLGAAPEFTDTQRWFNTPGGRPLSLQGLRGRVVLVDFWTYTCINCIRTLPYLKAWDAAYRSRRPDDRRRRDAGVRVRARRRQRARTRSASSGCATRSSRTTDMGTWNAYGNQAWPADYLIDARGQVRYVVDRRGRLRADRNGDPGAAGRKRRPPRRARTAAGASSSPRGRPRPRPTSAPTRAEGWLAQPRDGPARLRRPGHRRARAQRVRLQRPLADRRPARDRGRERRHRRRVPGAQRLPRAELARRTPAAGAVLLDGRPIAAARRRRRRPRRAS